MPTLMVAQAGTATTPLAFPAPYWDQMFDIWLVVAVVIYLLVALPMLYFLYRYRYRKGVNELGAVETGGPGIEILWTVVPLIVVIYLAVQSTAFYTQQRTAPPGAMQVNAEGMLWAWNFEYPNGKRTVGVLTIPVGKPINLMLTSRDVIHAFHIPAAKTMEDAVPGRVTRMWFQFNETGDYQAFCREYCGTAHSYMLARIHVVSEEEFATWLEQPG